MILCAFLGISKADISAAPRYARVLALNETGRDVLKFARKSGSFPNIGEKIGVPFEAIESRCDALYGLFAEGEPGTPIIKDRIFCQR